jgi:fluoride exporter
MSFSSVMIVGLGGFLGSVARFLAVRSIDGRLNAVFPYGTLFVNLVGSFLLGLVYAYLAKKGAAGDQWKIFLGAGFCGGFTTFSAFAWENLTLMQGRLLSVSLTYVAASLVGGLLAVTFGAWCSRFF